MPVNNISSQSLNNSLATQEAGSINHTATGRTITYTQENLNALKNIKNPNGASQCPLVLVEMYSNQANDSPNEQEYKATEKFKEDIDFSIYMQPYYMDKKNENMDNFFKSLIEKNIIKQDMLLQPLNHPEITQKLEQAGYKENPDKPGSYKNEDTKNSIKVSQRKTENGDTEWNLFFNGVNPKEKKSISFAVKNITDGLTDKGTSDILNYQQAKKAVLAFVEAAESTNSNIVISLSGHSMGGGLAEFGFSACPDKISGLYMYQAMHTTNSEVTNKLLTNKEAQKKMHLFHMTKDGFTGGTKEPDYTDAHKRKFTHISSTTSTYNLVRYTQKAWGMAQQTRKSHTEFSDYFIRDMMNVNPHIWGQ